MKQLKKDTLYLCGVVSCSDLGWIPKNPDTFNRKCICIKLKVVFLLFEIRTSTFVR